MGFDYFKGRSRNCFFDGKFIFKTIFVGPVFQANRQEGILLLNTDKIKLINKKQKDSSKINEILGRSFFLFGIFILHQ
jgi:hypothetical protein